MENSYVVREWVSVGPEKELRTHFEYGTFSTYAEANDFAKATGNPRLFPQQLEE